MNTIQEIFAEGRDASQIIEDLKVKSVNIKSWSELIRDYEPKYHKIVTDMVSRKDKTRSDGSVDYAARITIGLEKLLVKRMVEFMFSIDVKRVYHNIEENETRKQISDAMEKIYKNARINSENIKRGEAYFASCEFFTLWYLVPKLNNLYGFKSKYKLKCKTYSPMDGVDLYALIDEQGEMHCMSFSYKKKVLDEEVCFFETFTSDKHYIWKGSNNGWEQVGDVEEVVILKIPGVYQSRPLPLYDGLSILRNEIEYTISRNSDVIAYNSAPVLKVVGKIVGKEDKGESQRIFRVENGGDVGYVSWSQAIEALKYHVETLTGLFWSQSQMPDISFANMSKLGSIGYDARQTLLTDAYLKVGDESGAWHETFDRETNVIKAYLAYMNPKFKDEIDNIEVEHIITPFIQNDETTRVSNILKANGGKAVMSHIESIRRAGFSQDAENTLSEIQEEEAHASIARVTSVFGEGSM